MSANTSPDTNDYPPLPSSTTVYRAASNTKHLTEDRRKATPEAFYRRLPTPENPQRDRKGLSVGLTPEATGICLTRVRGIIALVVGEVRNLGLDVLQDKPTHANITGLPYRDPTDLDLIAKADKYAEDLAEIAKIPPELQP